MNLLFLLVSAALLTGAWFLTTRLPRWIQPRKSGRRRLLYVLLMLALMAAFAVGGGLLAIWFYKM
jgi:uncharacterized membrane protein YoaK (UPF0700 family)